MGAKCLYSVTIEPGLTPSAAEKELIRRVLAHTGRRISAWSIAFSALSCPSGGERPSPGLEIISISGAPGVRYVVTDGVVAEVGPGFDAVLKKASRYEQRSSRTVRGSVFDFHDLLVRVGLTFEKNAPQGVVVEIEARPCGIAEECAEMCAELMDKIAGPLVSPPQAGSDAGANAAATTLYAYQRVSVDIKSLLPGEPDSVFTNRHAAVLYVKLLSG